MKSTRGCQIHWCVFVLPNWGCVYFNLEMDFLVAAKKDGYYFLIKSAILYLVTRGIETITEQNYWKLCINT